MTNMRFPKRSTPLVISLFISNWASLTMPPYGKEGGKTSRSYIPNWYDDSMLSSLSRNLFVSSLNSQYAASSNSGSVQMPLVHFLPGSGGKERKCMLPAAMATRYEGMGTGWTHNQRKRWARTFPSSYLVVKICYCIFANDFAVMGGTVYRRWNANCRQKHREHRGHTRRISLIYRQIR